MLVWLAACASDPLDLQVTVELPDASVGGALWLTVSTSEPTELRVRTDDGTREREAVFDAPAEQRSIPILGFQPGVTALVEVTVSTDGHTASTTVEVPIVSLLSEFPRIEVLALDPEAGEPGWTLLDVNVPGAAVERLVVLDEAGAPIWWWDPPVSVGDARLGPDGFLWILANGVAEKRDWFGRVAGTWTPDGIPDLNHELHPTGDGFLSISYQAVDVDAFPADEADPTVLGPARIDGGEVLDVGLDGVVRRRWLMSDRFDTSRIGFDSTDFLGDRYDWVHLNAVVPDGDGIIVGMRHQDAIARLDGDGDLDWILGTPSGWTAPWTDALLTPVGDVVWPYHTHGAEVAPNGTIVLFDNHRFGYNPYEAAVAQGPSAAAGYRVDAAARTVTTAFRFSETSTGTLYSPALGDADLLPLTGNVLADFGFLDDENGVPHATLGWGRKAVRLVEFAPDGRVVFDVRLRSDLEVEPEGWKTYRADRFATPWPTTGVDAGRWSP